MKDHWQSVVFIDLDNTIIEGPFESVVFPTVFGELSERSGLEPQEIRYLVVRENLDRQKNPSIPAVLAMDWDDIIRTVSERLGISPKVNVLEMVRSHARPPHSVVLDDAYEVLQKLDRPHRAIVAATKGLGKYQIPVLEALNLTTLFTDILTPDSNNALKQDKAFYGQWPELAYLRISVGDHYEDDVLAPGKFGFKTIWKPGIQREEIELMSPFARAAEFHYREDQSIRPDAIILSPQELPEIVTFFEKQAFRNWSC